ncbi:hypothetical protein Rsub_02261 [Raphidocelis subcapitata]|uniref:UspA domain-containing protein n=1 Tax=Raphidocelis subcapitata TaxID=307507 RepID=A0A2V0NVG4_9CHLO|nr:hypothetical protein Rsub_02261 [Raphidocelis subcapitata]|eukprot:GBF89543.1 hypothetical protein Rsub_02261 [Raphidocelis subcapitata]
MAQFAGLARLHAATIPGPGSIKRMAAAPVALCGGRSSCGAVAGGGARASRAAAAAAAAAAVGPPAWRPRRRRAGACAVASAEATQAAWVGPAAPAASDARARTIVAVIDHSAASVRAVAWALENLYRDGDSLRLLHVVPPDTMMANGLTGHAASFEGGADEGPGELAARARAGIERAFVKRCVAAGARVEVDVVVQPSNRDVSDAILSHVEHLGAAVVVMPEQRTTLFEALFFQTPAAQRVAARCPRPTVLIR